LLLRKLSLSGCIVTIDAMGAQKEIAKQIVDDDGDYVLALKNITGRCAKESNRPLPALSLVNCPKSNLYSYETVEKGHGRTEARRHWMIDDPEIIAQLNPKGAWKGLHASEWSSLSASLERRRQKRRVIIF